VSEREAPPANGFDPRLSVNRFEKKETTIDVWGSSATFAQPRDAKKKKDSYRSVVRLPTAGVRTL